MGYFSELHAEQQIHQQEQEEAMAELSYMADHLYHKLSKYCNEEELSFLKYFLPHGE